MVNGPTDDAAATSGSESLVVLRRSMRNCPGCNGELMLRVQTDALFPKSIAMLTILSGRKGLRYNDSNEAQMEDELLAWGSNLLSRTFEVGTPTLPGTREDSARAPTFSVRCPICARTFDVDLQLLKQFADALQGWAQEAPGFISFFPQAGPTPAHEAFALDAVPREAAPDPVEPEDEFEKHEELLERLIQRGIVRRIDGPGTTKATRRRRRA